MLGTNDRDNEICKRLLKLAKTKEEIYFDEICKSVFDDNIYVQKDALIALGVLGDSRSYFILASLFQNLDYRRNLDIQRSIIYALKFNQDLRGRELLENLEKEPSLKKLAKRALKKLKPKKTLYTYLGLENTRNEARSYLGREIERKSLIDYLKKYSEHPQTYVIDSCGKLKVGYELEEHVQVASGEKVLAAGEIYFNDNFSIKTVNNRSNSYFPHESTIELVIQQLEKVGFNTKYIEKQAFPREGWLDREWLKVHTATIFQRLGPEYHHLNQTLFQ